MKKMKEKYKDQDEEDRQLIMKLLAVSNILNHFSCFSVGIQTLINIQNLNSIWASEVAQWVKHFTKPGNPNSVPRTLIFQEEN